MQRGNSPVVSIPLEMEGGGARSSARAVEGRRRRRGRTDRRRERASFFIECDFIDDTGEEEVSEKQRSNSRNLILIVRERVNFDTNLL